MDWSSHMIWWHVYPLGFVDAEREAVDAVEHRLPRLVGWLDYLLELGCNGLMLAPVFASLSHGYDTLDHKRIDPRLGDEADFEHLLAEAHARGIRVCLDGVFNHLARSHPLVQRALAAGPGTPEGDWLTWHEGYPWVFEGHEGLVSLNLANPEVADWVAGVMNHWLDRGVDAWRLDAAYAAGAEAWAPILAKVREAHPQAWIFAEVIHGDYAEFVAASGVDSVTQYELWHAIWDSLLNRNLFSLEWTLGRHRSFCGAFTPLTFISNHDVTRIASKLPDPRDVELAAVLLLLLPGIPSIYAGDEQGFTGEKEDHAYGDDAVRPPFPEDPADLLPYGADLHRSYQELIGIRRRHPWLVAAEVTTSEVANTWITITLTGPEEVLVLELNLAEEEVDGVGAHGWRLS
jgi:glycosidase